MAQQGGWRIVDIAKTIDRGHATIERWIKAYREGGIDGLLKREHHARKPRLSPDDIDA
ncbi:helix-turn-helix domain-containing protein [Candidatus Poribacteria bacterium]|nr:helix-turn-helix domain-containing protein [Candidatus Poribacteria bacterium]